MAKKQNIHRTILSASKTAGQTQRNWKDIKLPDQLVETIVESCKNMPTKSNTLMFELVVSTNTEINKKLYTAAISDDNEYIDGRNAQMNAPLVLLWCSSDATNKAMKIQNQSAELKNMCIGISSGAAALSANMLNLRTGFCRCFDKEIYQQLLFDIAGKRLYPEVALGIGYANDDMPRNQIVLDDNNTFKVSTHHKIMPATYFV